MDKNNAFAIMQEIFPDISTTHQVGVNQMNDPFIREAQDDVQKFLDVVKVKLGAGFSIDLSDAISSYTSAYYDTGFLSGMQTMQAFTQICKEPLEFRNYVKSQLGGDIA